MLQRHKSLKQPHNVARPAHILPIVVEEVWAIGMGDAYFTHRSVPSNTIIKMINKTSNAYHHGQASCLPAIHPRRLGY